MRLENFKKIKLIIKRLIINTLKIGYKKPNYLIIIICIFEIDFKKVDSKKLI